MPLTCGRVAVQLVAPHAGAWIEIRIRVEIDAGELVAPHAGAWIEIGRRALMSLTVQGSPPTRGRGLKLENYIPAGMIGDVAPHAGAWIEIELEMTAIKMLGVAPHAGAWIEIAA